MDRVDLHTHTTCSDGSYTPQELLQLAKDTGLKAVAITDHDSVLGIDSAVKKGRELGVEVISGIEFSCRFERVDLHLLGYFIDHENAKIREYVQKLAQTRHERNIELIERFTRIGITLPKERFGDDMSAVSRAHFADMLCKMGYCKDTNEAFSKYLSENGIAYVEREKFAVQQCISLIKDIGGISVLAHLNLINASFETVEALVWQLKQAGLDGIEGIYPLYDEVWNNRCRDLCEKHSLVMSGGSDFHGSFKAGLELGVGDRKSVV